MIRKKKQNQEQDFFLDEVDEEYPLEMDFDDQDLYSTDDHLDSIIDTYDSETEYEEE